LTVQKQLPANPVKQYFILCRPRQWIKNFFLFAPLVFSKHLLDGDFARTEFLAFIVFCLLSSAVYVINDLADRESDRLHPVKRMRPIASGAIGFWQGALFGIFLLLLAGALAVGLDQRFQVAAGIYFLLNIAYSFWLKRILLVDVFVIAAGFMLRVLAGAYAIDVVVSHWLILCTLFISVFLAVSKRRAEIMLRPVNDQVTTRAVLKEYDVAFIDQMMTVAASGMTIAYALYTVADRTISMFGTENLIFSTVFVLFGTFRYLHLVRKYGSEDNPTNMIVSDPVMITNVAAWFVTCVLIIYWPTFFGA